MNDWKRNGSGYYDKTFVSACRNIEGDRDMGKRYRGEIYEFFTKEGPRKVLIVGSNERAKSSLTSHIALKDHLKGDYNVPIACGGQMYADCACVCYGFGKYYGEFIRRATDKEMKAVDEMMKAALGLD